MTLGLALCALALFYLLFLPKPTPTDKSPAMPLSTESGPSGYQAAWRWLEAEQVRLPSRRVRRRQRALAQQFLHPADRVAFLIEALPNAA